MTPQKQDGVVGINVDMVKVRKGIHFIRKSYCIWAVGCKSAYKLDPGPNASAPLHSRNTKIAQNAFAFIV